MYKKETIIKNTTGLHARPAAEFIKTAKTFQSKLAIQRTDGSVAKSTNAKSMVTLLTLALACGEHIEISGDGPDEVAAVDALIALVDSGFGEL